MYPYDLLSALVNSLSYEPPPKTDIMVYIIPAGIVLAVALMLCCGIIYGPVVVLHIQGN